MASPARDFGLQALHYIRKSFDVLTMTTATVYEVGTIPAGAVIAPGVSGLYSIADFSGTTNTVKVGFAADSVSSANSTAYHSATPQETTGYYQAFSGVNSTSPLAKPVTVDRTVTVSWTAGGTTGAFDVVVAFMPKR